MLRLIPARAGNIARTGTRPPPQTAHPRSRGEHPPEPKMCAGSPGSSPLARGTWHRASSSIMPPRLIPARAGNMCRSPSRPSARSAHPRSRGEHHTRRRSALLSRGSSPLARGTSQSVLDFAGHGRLIPARAGNISKGKLQSVCHSAHPRSRGEHAFIFSFTTFQAGSSPLARGTWAFMLDRGRLCRLIPARAGNMPSAPANGQ